MHYLCRITENKQNPPNTLSLAVKKIGLLSDTHGYCDPRWPRLLESCDEIWHAGDFGSIAVAQYLTAIKPLRGVYGNIDGSEIRQSFPEYQRFWSEGVDVLMTHIGGYPGNYQAGVRKIMQSAVPPTLFISGHSHILKVMYDKKYSCLHINPGAAGRSGFHQVITLVRFEIDDKAVKNLEVIEYPRENSPIL